jgi:hypothetical protein
MTSFCGVSLRSNDNTGARDRHAIYTRFQSTNLHLDVRSFLRCLRRYRPFGKVGILESNVDTTCLGRLGTFYTTRFLRLDFTNLLPAFYLTQFVDIYTPMLFKLWHFRLLVPQRSEFEFDLSYRTIAHWVYTPSSMKSESSITAHPVPGKIITYLSFHCKPSYPKAQLP